MASVSASDLSVLEHLPAVAHRQHQVEGDRLRKLGACHRQRRLAVVRPQHSVAGRLEVGPQGACELVVVLRQQHARTRGAEGLLELGDLESERQRLAETARRAQPRGVHRQQDAEDAASAELRLDRHAAAVHLGEALDQRQPEPGAAHVAGGVAVHLPELLEDELLVLAPDAEAAVLDHELDRGLAERRSRRARRPARAAPRSGPAPRT